MAVAGILVLLVGIPHGATDHVIFNVLKQRHVKQSVPITFLLGYLGIMLVYLLLWWWQPGLSLIIFLVISAYHFGETQLIRSPKAEVGNQYLYLSWGLFLLAALLLFHIDEVATLLVPLVGVPAFFDWLAQHTVTLLAFAGANLVITWSWQAWRAGDFQFLGWQALEIVVLLLLLWRTPVLVGFALFFALWHSRDATLEQLARFRALQPLITLQQWVKMALPYTLMSLVGIATLIGIWQVYQVAISPVTVFFVGVSLLTMPHILLIYRFYQLPSSVTDPNSMAAAQ